MADFHEWYSITLRSSLLSYSKYQRIEIVDAINVGLVLHRKKRSMATSILCYKEVMQPAVLNTIDFINSKYTGQNLKFPFE